MHVQRYRSVLAKYLPPLGLLFANVVYAFLSVMFSPPVTKVDVASLLTEGLVAILPAIGLVVITGMHDLRAAYRPLLAGLALLTIAMVTDMLDEIVVVSDFQNIMFEGVFQVLGFLLILVGMERWVSHSRNLMSRLEHLATTDGLTGISNRRHFIELVNYELLRSQRQHDNLSVILFDIDHFKTINDRYGHDAGDRVLVAIAREVSQQIRASDLLARYGGEEFAILAAGTDAAGAQQLAEKCRLLLRSITELSDGVTASFGVAQSQPGDDVDKLLKRADVALYRAKHEGRDRVVAAHMAA